MVTKKDWKDFQDTGLLWWVNMILHTFGWAIVIETTGEKVTNAYPARVKFRGFNEDNNTKGYIKVSEYMKNTSKILNEEAKG